MFLGGIETSGQDEETSDISKEDKSLSLSANDAFDSGTGDSSTESQSESHSESSSAETATSDKVHKSNQDRRNKISSFLKDQREKKMAPKISSETQKLHCLKEELMLKRKMCERAELVDKEFLEHSNKMAKTMESVASTMSGCFQLMTSMFQAQMQQRNFSFGNVHQPPVMPMQNSRSYQQNWARDKNGAASQSRSPFSASSTYSEQDDESYLTLL